MSKYICFTNLKHLIFWNGWSKCLFHGYCSRSGRRNERVAINRSWKLKLYQKIKVSYKCRHEVFELFHETSISMGSLLTFMEARHVVCGRAYIWWFGLRRRAYQELDRSIHDLVSFSSGCHRTSPSFQLERCSHDAGLRALIDSIPTFSAINTWVDDLLHGCICIWIPPLQHARMHACSSCQPIWFIINKDIYNNVCENCWN
jgi:hypothetical protein